MPSVIDQIRASKLPSNMMQFAARGALQVSPAENLEILVHLARHNKIFGELARMTLAGWDEKSSRAAAADAQTSSEVLNYLVSPDNLRPVLLPALLENPSVPEAQLVKLAVSASRESIEVMLKSPRVRSLSAVLQTLKSNPYLKKEEAEELRRLTTAVAPPAPSPSPALEGEPAESLAEASAAEPDAATDPADDEAISAFLKEHAEDIAAESDKPFQPIGGVVELLGSDYFPVTQTGQAPVASDAPVAATPTPKSQAPAAPVRENALQKISRLNVQGRIQLALKGNKEERALLIRDGTKIVAFAVLEAPKLSDAEVEKFASQKNVLEAVLRQIPLKRKFMKNYKIVRNLVANPRTPLDLGLTLMKNILPQDLKNIAGNKDVSETIRNLALKMYKQKMEASAKK
jgi:peptidoglycan hydrolase-like protein with peptidoglycan-binding domain